MVHQLKSLQFKGRGSLSFAPPKKTLNLGLALIWGFAFGLVIATFRQLFHNAVINKEHIAGTPLLAALGFDDEAQTKTLFREIGRYSSRAKSFRQLRTNS